MSMTAYESSRQIDSNYYVDGGGQDILKAMQEQYNQYISQTQAFWNEARIDQRFLAGDQSIWNEVYSQVPVNKRRGFNLNKIRRNVNMISGNQRKNRKATITVPTEGADEETADQFSDIIAWAYKRDNVYHTISDSFENGSLVTGLSLLSVWMDYCDDPSSGDIRVNHLAYNSFMMDTFFRKQDLSDCNFIWTRKWLTKQEIGYLLPGREDEIETMAYPRYNRDQKFYFMPENYNFTIKDLLSYDEYWYQDVRDTYMLFDSRTGETMEWPQYAGKDRMQLYLNQYPEVKAKKVKKPTVRLAIVVNNRVMYDGPNPMKIDRYPFVPVLGYWDPDNIYFHWRMQGVVRGLRDAQFLYNRRKMIELDTMESQINSGVDVIEGSLVDNNDVLKAGQGQPVFVKATAPLGLDSIRRTPPPVIPATTLQLSEILSKEIQEISGVNEELLGMGDKDMPGVLSMLRQSAGLVTLQRLFDQLDLSQKILGEITMDLIQNNFTVGKVRRILGREPSEQFFNKAFMKYDVSVAEGILTESQQKLNFVQLTDLKALGMDIPSELMIDNAPIHDKKRLRDAVMKREQQAAEMQQQQAQLQLEGMQVDNKTKLSYAESQESLAKERLAKIETDAAVNIERIQRAQEEKSADMLNLVKAIKELQGMDLDHIMRQVEILKALEEKSEEPKGVSREKESAVAS